MYSAHSGIDSGIGRKRKLILIITLTLNLDLTLTLKLNRLSVTSFLKTISYATYLWWMWNCIPRQIVTSSSIIILSHTVVDIQFPPLQICSYGSPLVGYIWQCSSFYNELNFPHNYQQNISTIKYSKSSTVAIYMYIQRKSHNVCYIQSCYIADTCTERVTHFWLSGGRHMHAWRAYF